MILTPSYFTQHKLKLVHSQLIAVLAIIMSILFNLGLIDFYRETTSPSCQLTLCSKVAYFAISFFPAIFPNITILVYTYDHK